MGEEVTRSEQGLGDNEEDKTKLKKEKKKKSKKEKKEKKRSRKETAEVEPSLEQKEETENVEKEDSKHKREKKKHKKKDKEKDTNESMDSGKESGTNVNVTVEEDTAEEKDEKPIEKGTKAAQSADRKRKREEKKQKKKEALASIPERDEHGISYTKQQIRRMVRRVQRGLPPIATAEEEAELKRQDAELKKEEEMELAGMVYKGDDDDQEEEEEEEDKENEEEASEEKAVKPNSKVNQETNDKPDEDIKPSPNKKRKLSKKPVPADYVCQACKNKNNFPHFIYDCPDKVTVRGTNHVAAGRHGNNAPSAKKVFVSGLFFDTKPTDVKAMFQSCGNVTSCKLLKFPDTGRCKGQAFLVFDTEASAKKALELSGTKISASDTNSSSKSKKEKASTVRELELKVSKVMSRSFTKGKHKG